MTGTGLGTAPGGSAAAEQPRQRQAETVLITGASSGIGRELARLYASDGAGLVLIARSEGRLHQLADELAAGYGVKAQVVPADLSRPAGPREIVETLAQRHIEVDVLVNNAGFAARGSIAGIGADRQLEMIEVNVAALTALTALLLPGMLERRRGAILNVASTAGFQPGPNWAVYGATKAYVLSFTEALAEEVRGSGVRVSCLAPGATDTGFAATADMLGTRLFRRGTMDAGRVARAGRNGLRRGKTLIIPGLRNRVLAFSVRLSPRILVTKIAAYQNRG
jgi:short-subunit dehydrogenase